MKKIFNCYFLLLTLLYAQNNNDSLKTDETKLSFSTLFNPNYFLENQNNFINNININFAFLDSNSILTNTRLLISSFNNDDFFYNSPNQVLNPLYQNYLEKQKLKPLYQVLGTVQVGAIGYLAYQHLKKYGFLKKK